MKEIILTFVILTLTSNLFSQVKYQPETYLAISVGGSFPVSDFAEYDSYAKANTGGNTSLRLAIPVSKNFGVYTLVYGQAFSVDDEGIADAYRATGFYDSIAVGDKNWILGGALTGGYAFFPIDNGPVSVEAMILIGGIYTEFPAITISENRTSLIRRDGGQAWSFGYLIGAGLNYNVSQKVCLLLDLNYTGSSFEYQPRSGPEVTSLESQRVRILNLNFGFGFRF